MILGFASLSEVYTYATCVMLGISILMPTQALTSAPAYMVDYYKYVSGDENAEPNSPVFWANILTFYNLASLVTQSLCGPTVLTPWVRKVSLSARFTLALTLMMVELFVILVMPAGGVSQVSAMVAFFIVTIAAGAGKSYLEATCYATVGAMPPKFMSAVMFGCGFCGVIASILQCIVKVSMDSSYVSTLHQAYIYFSLALSVMAVALGMALSLRWNRYAQDHVGEFRVLRRAKEGEDVDGAEAAPARTPNEPAEGRSGDSERPAGEGAVVHGDVIIGTQNKEERLRRKAAGEDASDDVSDDELRAVADGDSDSNYDDRHLTTAEQLQRTKAWEVMKLIWPVMLACFINFFVSLFIFPSLIIPVDRTDKWFATLAILGYNCGDATGRLSSSLRCLWPSRRVLLICICCRVVFIPLTFLCIFKYIPGHAAPYIIFTLLGLTKGFLGATAMALGPADPRLRTEGQRVMAGQLMGMALLAGASASALLALLVVLYLP